jgi:NAD-dependent deacetylase
VCDRCGGRIRPHIVWFGERLDPSQFEAIDAFLARARGERLVFLAAGTSGVVYPAAGLVDTARAYGAETWLVNQDPADNASRFEHFVQGKSGEVLPDLLAVPGREGR